MVFFKEQKYTLRKQQQKYLWKTADIEVPFSQEILKTFQKISFISLALQLAFFYRIVSIENQFLFCNIIIFIKPKFFLNNLLYSPFTNARKSNFTAIVICTEANFGAL